MGVPAPAMQTRIGPDLNAGQLRHLRNKLIGVQEVEQRIGIFWKTVPMIQRLLHFDRIVVNCGPLRAVERWKLLSHRLGYVVPKKIVDHDISEGVPLVEGWDEGFEVN